MGKTRATAMQRAKAVRLTWLQAPKAMAATRETVLVVCTAQATFLTWSSGQHRQNSLLSSQHSSIQCDFGDELLGEIDLQQLQEFVQAASQTVWHELGTGNGQWRAARIKQAKLQSADRLSRVG